MQGLIIAVFLFACVFYTLAIPFGLAWVVVRLIVRRGDRRYLAAEALRQDAERDIRAWLATRQ